MDKLIAEPPLLVLPSLAKELGITDAILLQQLHYAGQREPTGWVERSFPDWHRALRGVFSARTIERSFAKLLERGWVETEGEPGKVSRWRVTPDKLTGDPRQGVPTDCRGSVSREEKRGNTSPEKPSPRVVLNPADEPDGFAQWLGFHVLRATETFGLDMSVPRAATSYRTTLAHTFKALQDEGYTAEDFELASLGVLSDDFMVGGGHAKPENVLRKTKIGGRIDAGRRFRASGGERGGKYGRFDG